MSGIRTRGTCARTAATTMTPAFLRKAWLLAITASYAFRFLSRTTTNRHGCLFPALGARRAASRIFPSCSSGTGSDLYFLMLLRAVMASKTSIARIPLECTSLLRAYSSLKPFGLNNATLTPNLFEPKPHSCIGLARALNGRPQSLLST